ncbi:MAG: hypothetical protein DMD78_01090 [Candidatus Rokuibacteriota bacterium]|nr:MAG: hypothetical protein DMD78_01090 [Candidatus Rokubacteria bacterium]
MPVEALLARARTELARGSFALAQRDAEALLQARVPSAIRAGALNVAADAAYGLRAYSRAAHYYRDVLALGDASPDAAGAAMALGWAELRRGRRDEARRAWTQLADRFPADTRAPLALILAAEVAAQAGDTTASARLLDSALARYAASPYVSLARLGRATVAVRRGRHDEALRDLEAVAAGGPAVVQSRSRLEDALVVYGGEAWLTAPASPTSKGPDGRARLDAFAGAVMSQRQRSPYLIHGVTLLAAADRGWPDSLTAALAARLVEDFPSYPPAPALLTRVAAGAASAGQWPIARRSYETLLARAPAAAPPSVRLQSAEALFRTGATAEARARLEPIAASKGAEAPRALLLLAQIHEAAGNRPAARGALQRLVQIGRADEAAEAAYRLAEGLQAEGEHSAAVEWYLTAAYVAERTPWARRALLGAGRSFTALRDPAQALAAYGKLVGRRPGYDPTDDRATSGEAAYLAGDVLRNAGLHQESLEMFARSADLAAGLPAERRALLAAMQTFLAIGDRGAAESVYRRLASAAAADPDVLARARQTLEAAAAPPSASRATESALPTTVR